METGSRFFLSESMFRIVRKIMHTVFPRIDVARIFFFGVKFFILLINPSNSFVKGVIQQIRGPNFSQLRPSPPSSGQTGILHTTYDNYCIIFN